MGKKRANDRSNTDAKAAFQRAAEGPRTTLISEFTYFLREHKKWWLLPILIAFGVLGLLAALSGSGAAPFIYTVF